ncbi:MAG: hypothetical protein AB8B73_11085 [Ekhidna sp.]
MRLLFLALLFPVIWMSCSTNDEILSSSPSLELLFSSDTVAFDTLLSNGEKSNTNRLQILNPNEESILISSIDLGLGENSDYSIIVNGRPSTSFQNEQILGGDSILILVDVTVNPRNRDEAYLVKDSIIVNWNGNTEHVKLVSYGQDVKRVDPQSICNTTWANDRPYYIDGVLEVSEGCTLTIEAGTEIYFYNNSLLLVSGSLIAQGDSDNNISFSSSRFDSGYDMIPGQWSGIIFMEQSTENQLAYCTIENADIAIGLGYQIVNNGLIPGDINNGLRTEIEIENSTIRNASTAGLLAFNSVVSMTNSLVYNCGSFLIGNFAGGAYSYQHCTITNESSFFINDEPTVQFSDNAIVGDELLVDDLNLELTNTIIWGSQDEEMLINNGGEALITSNLRSNIIRSGQDIADNFTSLEFNFPGFSSPFANDYSLDTLAFAKDQGLDIGIIIDIIDSERDAVPDIGAYERIEKE